MPEPMQTRPSSGVPALLRGRGLVLLLAVLAVAVAAVLFVRSGARPRPRPARVAVAVARVERRAMPLEVDATGTVEPSQSAAVTAQVGGAISRIAFRDGAGRARPARSCSRSIRARSAPRRPGARRCWPATARRRRWRGSRPQRAESLAGARTWSPPSELDQKRAAAEAAARHRRRPTRRALATRAPRPVVRRRCARRSTAAPGELRVDLGDLVRADRRDAARDHQPACARSACASPSRRRACSSQR